MSTKGVPTIADVLHHMYLAADNPYRFTNGLAVLLKMDVANLRTLYDQAAPDPASPDFDDQIHAIAERVTCDPAALTELLREWTPDGYVTSEDPTT